LWSAFSGEITLKANGTWVIRYQDSSSPNSGNVIDVPGVSSAGISQPSDDIEVYIVGKDTEGSIDLNAITGTGHHYLHLMLEDGGAVNNDINCSNYGMQSSTIPGGISAGTYVQLANISGSMSVGTGVFGDIDFEDKLWQDRPFTINGNVGAAADIHVKGAAEGLITITGDMNGDLVVDDDLGQSGTPATIRINGDMGGSISIGGDILDVSRILIDGTLADNAAGHEITVAGTMASGVIVVDYDGWDVGDFWEGGATIEIDETE